MKKRRILFAVLACVLMCVAVAALVTACNEEPVGNTYKLTFDTGGATLTTPVSDIVAEAGAYIEEAVNSQKEISSDSYYFGGWYLTSDCKGEAVELPVVMPSQDVTYYAKWYVKFSVNVMKQPETMSEDHADYVLDANLSRVYEGVPGATVDLFGEGKWPLRVEGFVDTTSDDGAYQLKLTKKDNERNIYFDRISYTLTLHSGLDDDATVVKKAYYGVDTKFTGDEFEYAGRKLTGFEAGKTKYNLDEAYKFSSNTDLYAVWNEGYTDRDGGDDYIYLDMKDSSVVWLEREGMDLVKGHYAPLDGTFAFSEGENQILSGKLYNDDHTFYYDREQGLTYYFADINTGEVDENSYITLGKDGKAQMTLEAGVFSVYEIYQNGGSPDIRLFELPAGVYNDVNYYYDYGEYVFSMFVNRIEYTFAFTTGLVAEYLDNTPDMKYFNAFLPRGKEAAYYATEYSFDESGQYIYFGSLLILDGYGNALYMPQDRSQQWAAQYAITTDPTLGLPVIYVTDGEYAMQFMVDWSIDFVLAELEGGMLAFSADVYDPTATGMYYANDGSGDTLTVTGYGVAAWHSEAGDVNYVYEVASPADMAEYMGTTIVDLSSINASGQLVHYKRLRLDYSMSGYGSDTFEEVGSDADLTYLTDLYGVSKILFIDGEYCEYYELYVDPLYVNLTYYDLCSVGSVSYDSAKRTYTYTADDDGVEDFSFYKMHGTFYYEGTLAFDGETFTNEDGKGSSIIMEYNGDATYVDVDGVEHAGEYWNLEEGVLSFECADISCNISFDFTVNEAKNTFKLVLPEVEKTEYLRLGDGNEKLVVNDDMTVNVYIMDGGEFVLAASGSLEEYDLLTGKYVFKQASVVDGMKAKYDEIFGGGDFVLMLGYDEKNNLVFDIKDGHEGEYPFESGNKLTLDGFGYGSYTLDGEEINGVYGFRVSQSGATVLIFIDADENVYYFDFFEDGSLHERGIEGGLGAYYTDGTYYRPLALYFDGYGNIELMYYSDVTGTTYMLNENGTYEFTGVRGHYSIHLYFDEFYPEKTDEGELTQAEADMLNALIKNELGEWGIKVDENGYADFEAVLVVSEADDDLYFYVKDPDKELHIVFDDWSVLKTDGVFSATYVDKYGKLYDGYYSIEYYGEGDDAYSIVRFYNGYDDFAFVITADGDARLVGYEIGYYVNEASGMGLSLDGEGNAILIVDAEGGYAEGTYTFDEHLERVYATFHFSDDDMDLEIEISRSYMAFSIKNEASAGEFTDENDPDNKMYGNGFGSFLIHDENGDPVVYYLIGQSPDQENVYYFIDAQDVFDGMYLEDDIVPVRINLEERTFAFADKSIVLAETPLFSIYTGEVDESKSIAVDGFGVVTIGGEEVGTYVSHARDALGGFCSYTVYVYNKLDGTESKFSTFITKANDYFPVYAPYDAKYDVTLTASNGSGTIKLDGMANAQVSGVDDTLYRHCFIVTGSSIEIHWYIPTSSTSTLYTMYNVDWEAGTYLVGEDASVDGFIIVNGVLTQYIGSAKDIVIPAHVVEIANGVFQGMDITSVDLAGVVRIGEDAFAGLGLSELGSIVTVTGGEKVEVVGARAFKYQILTSISLPSAVVIGEEAFYATKDLTSVYLGENLQSIGYHAFFGAGAISKELTLTFAGEHAPQLVVDDNGNYGIFGTSLSVARTLVFENKTAYDEAVAGENGWAEYSEEEKAANFTCSAADGE